MGSTTDPEKAPSFHEEGIEVDKEGLCHDEAAGIYGDPEDAKRYGYVQRGYVLVDGARNKLDSLWELS